MNALDIIIKYKKAMADSWFKAALAITTCGQVLSSSQSGI